MGFRTRRCENLRKSTYFAQPRFQGLVSSDSYFRMHTGSAAVRSCRSPRYVAFNGKKPPPDLECWATESGQPLPGVHVASALLPPRVTDVPVRILNSLNHALDIDKGTVLSSLIAVEPRDAAAGRNTDFPH
jgi:hypothetical protein